MARTDASSRRTTETSERDRLEKDAGDDLRVATTEGDPELAGRNGPTQVDPADAAGTTADLGPDHGGPELPGIVTPDVTAREEDPAGDDEAPTRMDTEDAAGTTDDLTPDREGPDIANQVVPDSSGIGVTVDPDLGIDRTADDDRIEDPITVSGADIRAEAGITASVDADDGAGAAVEGTIDVGALASATGEALIGDKDISAAGDLSVAGGPTVSGEASVADGTVSLSFDTTPGEAGGEVGVDLDAGPARDAVDEGADALGDAVEDGAEVVGDQLDETGDSIENSADAMGDDLPDPVDDVLDAATLT